MPTPSIAPTEKYWTNATWFLYGKFLNGQNATSIANNLTEAIMTELQIFQMALTDGDVKVSLANSIGGMGIFRRLLEDSSTELEVFIEVGLTSETERSFAHDLLYNNNAFTQRVIDNCGKNGLQIDEISRKPRTETLQEKPLDPHNDVNDLLLIIIIITCSLVVILLIFLVALCCVLSNRKDDDDLKQISGMGVEMQENKSECEGIEESIEGELYSTKRTPEGKNFGGQMSPDSDNE